MSILKVLQEGFSGLATIQGGSAIRSCPLVLRYDVGHGSSHNAHDGDVSVWSSRTDGVVRFTVSGPAFSVFDGEIDFVRTMMPSRDTPFARWSLAEIEGCETRQWSLTLSWELVADSITSAQVRRVATGLRDAADRAFHTVLMGRKVATSRHWNQIRRDQELFDVRWELNELVGLAPVKAFVDRLAAEKQVAARRAAEGLEVPPSSPHLVFTGNPGTGKTTVARLIGRLYKSLGLLKKGHVIEAERATLIAPYLGQTAARTMAVCESALDGVLFIDEAYSLDVDGRDYGREAIETLLTFMERNRGRVVVVMAGYPEEMEQLLDSNPGLRSRFDATIHFPDHSDSELMDVLTALFDEYDYHLTDNARSRLIDHVASIPRGRGFGNAREMHRLFRHLVGTHAAWVCPGDGDQIDPDADLSTIDAHMIPEPHGVLRPARDLIQVLNPGYL